VADAVNLSALDDAADDAALDDADSTE
jgi:hypothetical protein